MKTKIFATMFILFLGLVCFYTGCVLEETGTLQINLTDDPAEYEEVYITFSEISVHQGEEDAIEEETKNGEDDGDDEDDVNGGNWIIISEEEQGFDLLTLQDGKFDLLATEDLDAGLYTQIRLKIVEGEDKTYITIGDDTYPLEVPSGTQSGLKLIHPFEIIEGGNTVLFLDFDAEKSVLKTGNDQYKLKPTIKILSQGVKGTVVDSNEYPIAGAIVSASGENVETESFTTGENGTFEIPLTEGTYTVEITADNCGTETIESVEVMEGKWVNLGSIKLMPY
jgi:hypothetical protein